MSNVEDSALGQDPTRPARKSGRAVFGVDGRSSWEWQTSTGVFSRDITDVQLSQLEASQLQLVDSEAITRRRSQRTLTHVPLRAVARTTHAAPADGRLRRLWRRVAQLLS